MPRRLKLALIGDPHLAIPHGDPDPRLEVDPGRKLHGLSVELLAETVRQVNAESDIDAVVVLGDITRDSEEFNHLRALEVLRQIEAPYYLLVGNHDIALPRRHNPASVYSDVRRFSRQDYLDFYAGHGIPGHSGDYSVGFPGGVRLLILDSTLIPAEHPFCGFEQPGEDDGWLAPQQLGWLDAELERSSAAGELVLPILHHAVLEHSPAEVPGHPLEPTFRFWKLLNSETVLDLLQSHQVPLVLSGHLHAQSANHRGALLNLVTSATVSYPHAWRLLTVDDAAIHIESRLLQSTPSVADLQHYSRSQMLEGMDHLIHQKLSVLGSISVHAEPLAAMVRRSEWWARFSSGTLAGWRVDPALIPELDNAGTAFAQLLVGLLNDYGRWAESRPDPNTLEVPLDFEKRWQLFESIAKREESP